MVWSVAKIIAFLSQVFIIIAPSSSLSTLFSLDRAAEHILAISAPS
jgi:hypothetical protein